MGLGNLILKDKERMQPKAGRLDILLQDPESYGRYEVEVQLGSTDESHIIRTIEYWDIERKRFPQYDHTAVIVAEDITSRFLNVISLFNGSIPLVAIQMRALRCGDQISLVFTKVVDQITLGFEEDDEVAEATDRAYWEKQASKEMVQLADKLHELMRKFVPAVELTYRKFYIGLSLDGRINNFAVFQPQKNAIRLEVHIPKSDDIEKQISEKDIDLTDYTKWGTYRLRLSKKDIEMHSQFLMELMKQAYEESRK